MEMYINAEYRQRKREFKNSCRIYISEKSHLLSLEKKYPFLKNEPATEDSAILHTYLHVDGLPYRKVGKYNLIAVDDLSRWIQKQTGMNLTQWKSRSPNENSN